MSETTFNVTLTKNQPQEDAMLYRYITIDKLFDFLLNEHLPLVRLNIFEDRLEGVSIEHLRLNYISDELAKNIAEWVGGSFKHLMGNVNPTKRNNLKEKRELFQNTNYANCWYINNHESVAMWQLYSGSDSVAIRIPYKSLSNELIKKNFKLSGYNYQNLQFGNISYYKFSDPVELGKIIIEKEVMGFIKDYSFQHEQEFRLMVQTKPVEHVKELKQPMILDEKIEEINNRMEQRVMYLKLSNFKNLPFEIVFHPRASDWHRKNVMELINKYELTFKTHESSLKDIFKR